jgi:Ala-tRNA(Pro) deacylase
MIIYPRGTESVSPLRCNGRLPAGLRPGAATLQNDEDLNIMLAETIDTHDRIMALLAGSGAEYRTLDHEPEGRTDLASQIRGHVLSQAAKAMVVAVRSCDNERRRFVLAVVPGDRRVNFDAIARAQQGRKASLASAHEAANLTRCEMGAVPPFSFDPKLTLMVDVNLMAEEQIVFNAGRLDRSIFLRSDDYLRLAQPYVDSIAA